jgi:hypothetical protein
MRVCSGNVAWVLGVWHGLLLYGGNVEEMTEERMKGVVHFYCSSTSILAGRAHASFGEKKGG